MNEIAPSRATRVRCAIYTRKSSDEGLDQEFNSLDAQREACTAYIRSQAHENWRALPEIYDDGGHSGGSLERPALKRLIEAVRGRRIDVIVVYKIDRLTRSLADFARLAELLDANGVSFVSITQQFNTTTSMGRLMLNVLLSFAQFEREITAERIRDKIAASKKKGMWMGGIVPIGYEVRDRALHIDPEQAEEVRTLFRLYLELGTVAALEKALVERGIRTKGRQLADGRSTGALPFSRGHLYRLLKSPIYAGRIGHKTKSYPGLHEAIINPDVWDRVQTKLEFNTQGPARRRAERPSEPGMLVGLLVDGDGRKFTLSHANKRGRRYHYYVCAPPAVVKAAGEPSRIRRLPAPEIEEAVRRALTAFVGHPSRLAEAACALSAHETQTVVAASASLKQQSETFVEIWANQIRPTLARVVVYQDRLQFDIHRPALRRLLSLPVQSVETEEALEAYSFALPVVLLTRGKQIKLVLSGTKESTEDSKPDKSLLRTLVRARRWFDQLKTGQADSIAAIAADEQVTGSYVTRILRLAFLSPTLIEQILDGRQPWELSADRFTLRSNVPIAWREQDEWARNSDV